MMARFSLGGHKLEREDVEDIGCWLQLWRCWGYRWCWKPFWIWGSFPVPGKHSFSHNENIARWKTTAARRPRKVLIFLSLDLQLDSSHWCLVSNLKIGIYNGEMFFNRLLGNGWSDLDDFFCRPPGNFNSDKKVKKSAGQHSSTCVRLLH